MKQLKLTLVLTLLMSFVGYDCYAYDFKEGDFYYNRVDYDNVIVTSINKLSSNHPEYDKETIVIPSSVKDWNMGRTYNVVGIDDGTFNNCTRLKNITIPNSVTSIGEKAFHGCYNLTSITIPNSVTSIGKWAFARCTGFTSFTIPNNVTSIGDRAFEDCTGLTSITIPNSVTSIGECPFAGCCALSSITVAAGNTYYDSRNNCNSIIETATNTLIQTCKNSTVPNGVEKIAFHAFEDYPSRTSITLPNSLREIGIQAFYNCSSLVYITIPDGVTLIDDGAFWGCSSLMSYLYLPKNLIEIGEFAFYDCSSLAYVNIPNSVTSIGRAAFGGCDNLRAVEVGHDTPIDLSNLSVNPFEIHSGLIVPIGSKSKYENAIYWKDFYHIEEKTRNDIIVFADDLVKSICVSNWDTDGDGEISYDEAAAVTSIPWNTFSNTAIKSFTEFYYFTGITNIGSYFTNCFELTDIILPPSVTVIGGGAFESCYALKFADIPEGVTTIGPGAYFQCRSLKNIHIPSTVSKLGNTGYENPFIGCTGLENIFVRTDNATYTSDNTSAIIGQEGKYLITGCKTTRIPQTVQFIGASAFEGISDLTSITIPNNITSIGDYAFRRTGLTSIVIPEGVTTIGYESFSYCNDLACVDLPVSLSSLATESFSDNANLKEVTCHWTTPIQYPTGSYGYNAAFWNISSECCLYVPSGTLDAYTEKGWTSRYFKGGVYVDRYIITADDKTIHYGETPVLTYTIADDTGLEGTPSLSCEATATSPIGMYEITVSQGTVTNKNVDYINGTLTIEQAPLTVTANSYTITKGDPLPTFDCTYSGFQNDETEAVLTQPVIISCSATSNSAPGTYDILVSNGYAENYNISYVNGTLTINPKDASTLTINPISAVTYNGSAQTPTVTVKDGSTTLTSGTHYTVSYSDNTNAGTATVTITGMGNYTGTKNANFTINKAALTITANSYTIDKGDALPSFAVSYSGFKNGETSSVLTTLPIVTCTASDSETPGVFDITPSGAAATNYSFNYVKGTLTINANVTIAMRTGSGDARNLIAYSSNYGLDFSSRPEIKAYIACGYNWKKEVMLVHVNIVPPYTGMVIRTSNSIYDGGEYEVPITTEDYYYSNLLVPVVETQTVTPTETIYNVDYTNFSIGTLNGGDIGFVKVPSNWTTHNKSYLRVPTSLYNNTPSARELGGFGIEFVEGDEATAIQNIKNDALENDGDYYDLQGRKVKPLSKGIYIHNGKKVFVK